jgi:hypothetical protein
MCNQLEQLSDAKLISQYGCLVKELQNRKIIRTKNVVGDLGERFSIDYFTSTEGLENLSDAPPSTKSIDAIGEFGNKYAIKSITGNLTGVFYGLPHKDSNALPIQLFDFLLIVKFTDSYEVNAIYELTWEQFLKYKKWHSRMEAWNITLSKNVINEARIVYAK